jgi:SAM-dependent methyltransferase
VSEFVYVGGELDLFAAAKNWKSYWSRQIKPFLNGEILEVGAGIGSNTGRLDTGGTERWVCLEPDPRLVARLTETLSGAKSVRKYEIVCGTLQSVAGQLFDTITYIDVLEHIQGDRDELAAAATHLRPGGRIVVLSPAHQWLFSPFDAAIGHSRRYNRAMLRNITPASLRLERIKYLDCAGLAASASNLLFLRQSLPTATQLAVWDGWMVPVSQVLDRLTRYSVGKSIVAVWRKS